MGGKSQGTITGQANPNQLALPSPQNPQQLRGMPDAQGGASPFGSGFGDNGLNGRPNFQAP
ncbi:hypothetical protein RGC27_08165, partial [Helicobacter pylori]|uniref:hypothetical protein n=1 Tax=Helicobacter pylori TaxID=210 RepID=UPI0029291959